MVTRGTLGFLAIVTCVAMAGCGGGGSSSSGGVASVSIDAEGGGTLQVDHGPLQGMKLIVSPGSLSEDLVIGVGLSTSTSELAYREVGPSAQFFPAFANFAPPATLIMPFDLASVPPDVADEEMLVRKRAFGRTRAGRVPFSIDREKGFISIPVANFDDLASFWVARRREDASIELESFLPRGGLEIYRFPDGSQIRLRTASSHPNLPLGGPVTEMAFIDEDGEGGFYLMRQPNGDIVRVGEYFFGGVGYQEVHEPIPWAPSQLMSGGGVSNEVDYVAFAPFGSSTQVYTGQVATSTRVELQFDELMTQAGEFSDVLRFEWHESFTDSFGGAGSFTLVLLLAQGIGPVGYGIDDGPLHLLTFAVVGGQQIGPLALIGNGR